MKIFRYLFLILCIAVLVFAASRSSTAQPAPGAGTNDNGGSFDQLAASLNQSGQSNALDQMSNMILQMSAKDKTMDIAFTVAVLKDIRTGNTNAAIDLLETKLDDALAGYDTLPHSSESDRLIERARQYRNDFPHTTGNTNVDAAVERALNSKAAQ